MISRLVAPDSIFSIKASKARPNETRAPVSETQCSPGMPTGFEARLLLSITE
jgi:hypothetical protein